MNWVSLNHQNIPLVERQIECAVQLFHQIKESVIEGDILGIQKMSEMQLSVSEHLTQVKKRIIEMEEFYSKNCYDQRVRYLENSRIKLVKLFASNHYSEIEKTCIKTPWKMDKQKYSSKVSDRSANKTQRSKITISNVQTNRSNKQNQQREVNFTQKASQFSSKKSLKQNLLPNAMKKQKLKNEKPNKTPSKFTPNSCKGQNKIICQKEEEATSCRTPAKKYTSNVLKKQEKQKSSFRKSNRESTRNLRMAKNSERKAQIQMKQLVFTIKMTKQEYQDLLKIKKGLVNEKFEKEYIIKQDQDISFQN